MAHKFAASREFSAVGKILQSALKSKDLDLCRSFEVIMVMGGVFVVFWFVVFWFVVFWFVVFWFVVFWFVMFWFVVFWFVVFWFVASYVLEIG
jgi:hypothetical protein